jgi:hypothetical protein
MKKTFVTSSIVAIVLAILTISAVPGTTFKPKKKTLSVEGTWELVSYKYGPSQSAFIDRTESLQRLKVINKTHFIWVDFDKSGKVMQSAGGTYTLNGDTYTEFLGFGYGMDQYLKTNPQFTIKIDGDMLFQTGLLTPDYKIEEIWKRVK